VGGTAQRFLAAALNLTPLRAEVPSAVLVAVLSLTRAVSAGTDPLRPRQYGRVLQLRRPRSVAAPRADISTVPGDYARKCGTSMAAPQVGAEAALLIGLGADPATVRE